MTYQNLRRKSSPERPKACSAQVLQATWEVLRSRRLVVPVKVMGELYPGGIGPLVFGRAGGRSLPKKAEEGSEKR